MPTRAKNKANIPNPALEPFRVLIGEWDTVGTHPLLPNTTLQGHASFEWLEDGAFILMRTEIDHAQVPNGIAIFGSDDERGEFYQVYFDERGISRKYDMSLQDNVWKWWRNTPEFSQRVTNTITDGGDTIIGKGEMSRDGSTWEGDLNLTYRRAK
jgi:hypothetical protein